MNRAFILCLFLQLALSKAHENIVSQNQPLAEGKLCLFTCSEWIFQEKVWQFAPSAELLGPGQLSKLTIGLPCEDSSSHSEEGPNLHYQGVWGAVYVIDECEYNAVLRQSQSEYQIAFASNELVVVPKYADLNCLAVDLGIQSGSYPPRQHPSHKLPNGDLDEAYYNQLANLGVPQDYINGLRNISQKPSNHHYPHIPRDYHSVDNGPTIQPGHDQIPVQNQQNRVLPNSNNGLSPTGRSGSFQVPVTRDQYPQGNQLHTTGNDDSSADTVDQPFVEITPIRLSGDDYNTLHPESSSNRPVSHNGRRPTNVQEQYPQQTTPEYATGTPLYRLPGRPSSVQQPSGDDYNTLHPESSSNRPVSHNGRRPTNVQEQYPQQTTPEYATGTPLYRLPGRPSSVQQPSGDDYNTLHPESSSNRPVSHNGRRPTNVQEQYPQQTTPEYATGTPLYRLPGRPSSVQQSNNYSPSEYLQPSMPYQNFSPSQTGGLAPNTRGYTPNIDQQQIPQDNQDFVVISPIRLPLANNGRQVVPHSNQKPSFDNKQEEITPNGQDNHPTNTHNAPKTETDSSQQGSGEKHLPCDQTPQPHTHLQSNVPRTGSLGLSRPLDNSISSPQRPSGTFVHPDAVVVLPVHPGEHSQPVPRREFSPHIFSPNSNGVRSLDKSSPESEESPSTPVKVLINPEQTLPLPGSDIQYEQNPINSQSVGPTTGNDSSPVGHSSVVSTNPDGNDFSQYPTLPLQRQSFNRYPTSHTTPPQYGIRPGGYPAGRFIPNAVRTNYPPAAGRVHINPNYPNSPQNSPLLTSDSDGTQPNVVSQFPLRQSAPITSQYTPQGVISPQISPEVHPNDNSQVISPTQSGIQPVQPEQMFYPKDYSVDSVPLPSDGNDQLCTDTPMFTPDNYPFNTRQNPPNGNTPSTDNTMFIPDNYHSNARQIPSNGNTTPCTDTRAVIPDVQHLPSDYNSIQHPPSLYDHPMFVPDNTQSAQYPSDDSLPYLSDEQMFFPDNYPQDSQGVLPVTDINQPYATGLLPESTLVQDHSQRPTPLGTEQVPHSIDATPITSTNQPHATGLLPESTFVQDHSQRPTPLGTEQVPRSIDATPITSTNQPHATGLLPESTLVQDHSQGPTPLETEQVPRSIDATPITSTNQPHATGLRPESTLVQDHSQGSTLETKQSTPVTDASPVMSTDQYHNAELQPQLTNGHETIPSHGIKSVQQGDLSQQSNQFGVDAGFTQASNYNPSTFIAPNYSPDLPSLGFSLAHYFPQSIQQYSPQFMPSVDCYGPDSLIPGFTFGNHVQLY